MHGLTKEDRIKTVYGGGGHVVILGAGASIASALRNPEPGGKKLPSMNNFIEVVGLQDIVEILSEKLQAKNFEELYSRMYDDNPESDEVREIEKRVQAYFSEMKLPPEATIYDHLVLALRPRDLIATFNWDPFLYQAYVRNREVAALPFLAFLHGNVAIGYGSNMHRAGPAGWTHKETLDYFEPTKLLYPIKHKNYNQDEFMQREWGRIKFWLHKDSTKIVTIFGFGAPDTDVEAVKLLDEAWGGYDKRNLEQFEIINSSPEDQERKKWDSFIHTHHYDYSSNYFNSSLALNPRRTFESYFQHCFPSTPSEAFSESNPVPDNIHSIKELWDWHRPLIDAEEEWKRNNPEKESNN
jgi:hypothetical protein